MTIILLHSHLGLEVSWTCSWTSLELSCMGPGWQGFRFELQQSSWHLHTSYENWSPEPGSCTWLCLKYCTIQKRMRGTRLYIPWICMKRVWSHYNWLTFPDFKGMQDGVPIEGMVESLVSIALHSRPSSVQDSRQPFGNLTGNGGRLNCFDCAILGIAVPHPNILCWLRFAHFTALKVQLNCIR